MMVDPVFRKLSSSKDRIETRLRGIDQLKAFDQAEMKSWLISSLEKYFFQAEGRYAFRPVEFWVGDDVDISLDLYAIYNELSVDQRTSFRTAISDALAQMPHEERQASIFECLLMLAKIIPAYEVLTILPRLLEVGWFGADQFPIEGDLFSRTLFAVADMAVQTDAAIKCIRLLTTTHQFKSEPRYAPLALITLCRVDPDSWPDHLERLRYPLNAGIRKYGLTNIGAGRLARQFLDAIKADRIFGKPNAFVLDKHFRAQAVTDQWLWDALFAGPSSLFENISFDVPDDNGMVSARYILRNDPTNVFSYGGAIQREAMGSVSLFLPTPSNSIPTRSSRGSSRKEIKDTIKRIKTNFIDARILSPAKTLAHQQSAEAVA